MQTESYLITEFRAQKERKGSNAEQLGELFKRIKSPIGGELSIPKGSGETSDGRIAFQVSGNCLHPLLHHGDLAIFDPSAEPQWNKIHLIIDRFDPRKRLVKFVSQGAGENYILTPRDRSFTIIARPNEVLIAPLVGVYRSAEMVQRGIGEPEFTIDDLPHVMEWSTVFDRSRAFVA